LTPPQAAEKKPSLLVITLGLDSLGGTNAVAAYAVQLLARHYRITVLSYQPQEPSEADRLYGTHLADLAIDWRTAQSSLSRLVDRIPHPHFLFALHALMRSARKVAHRFDRCLCLQNEVDLGRACVQYVHFPWSYQPRSDAPPIWQESFALRLLLRLYYTACQALSGYSPASMRRNVSLVNSKWTGERLAALGATPVQVLYPPIPGPHSNLSWDQRQDGVVCLGRFSPEKRLDLVVRVLEGAREKHPSLRLHLIGSFKGSPPGFSEHLRPTLEAHPWIQLHEKMGRPELLAFLSTQRYGIHAMENEHFGMAVAEMLLCGCLPLVHRSGGALEIVEDEPALTYADESEAVARMLHLLAHPDEQLRLRRKFADTGSRFTMEQFADGLLQALETDPVPWA
jgi:glycosyltransferase involved in cell wall biosynthesis